MYSKQTLTFVGIYHILELAVVVDWKAIAAKKVITETQKLLVSLSPTRAWEKSCLKETYRNYLLPRWFMNDVIGKLSSLPSLSAPHPSQSTYTHVHHHSPSVCLPFSIVLVVLEICTTWLLAIGLEHHPQQVLHQDDNYDEEEEEEE